MTDTREDLVRLGSMSGGLLVMNQFFPLLRLTAGGIGNVLNAHAALARNTLQALGRFAPNAQSQLHGVVGNKPILAGSKHASRKTVATLSGHSLRAPSAAQHSHQASLHKGSVAALAVLPEHPMASSRTLVNRRPPARTPQIASDDWVQVNIGLQSSML